MVEVTHLGKRAQAVVKVNDRGLQGRPGLDLSYAAAQAGIYGPGPRGSRSVPCHPAQDRERRDGLVPPRPAQSRSERVGIAGSFLLPSHHPALRRAHARPNLYSFHVGTVAQRGQLMSRDSTPHLRVSTSGVVPLDPTPREPPVPTAASGGPAERGWFLQVGAFSEATNAERLRARIGAMLAPMLGTVHEPGPHPPSRSPTGTCTGCRSALVGTEMVERIGARLSNIGCGRIGHGGSALNPK